MPLLTETASSTPPPGSSPPHPTAAPGTQPVKRGAVRLGEELPIFCERCGYSLHGLPQSRCERCTILHYACPECNHHQPINTLRPALQRMLGRVRAFTLGLWVLFKLNFFGWLLFAWGAMGVEWTYEFGHVPGGSGRSPLVPRPLDIEVMLAFGVFALVFGVVSRMLLLRWRSSVAVGAVLGALVAAAAMTGAYLWWLEASTGWSPETPSPLHSDLPFLAAWAAGIIVLGASIVWPIWLSLVYLFLPKATGQALVEWQRSLSEPKPKKEPALAN